MSRLTQLEKKSKDIRFFTKDSLLRMRTRFRAFDVDDIIKINGQRWKVYCVIYSEIRKDWVIDIISLDKNKK